MSRRTWAGVVALGLALGLAVVAFGPPVPYAVFRPGPTVDVLGEVDDEDVISISGRRTYDAGGRLRLLTIVPSGPGADLNLADVLGAWIDPARDVYPYDSLYSADDTRESNREESAALMMSSQDMAIAAALRELDIPFDRAVRVSSVDKDGPAKGKLRPDDVIVAVDGEPVASSEALVKTIRAKSVGTRIVVATQRGERRRDVTLTTVPAVDDGSKSAVRVGIAPSFEFPFEVDLEVADNIGGPSGGLVFALAIYDKLTPGSLTGKADVAGTGEVDANGRVGSIGGVRQKIVAAQDAGAELFLVPAGNCAEALAGRADPDRMRLVRVDTVGGAIADIKRWVEDPDADLTGCTS